MSGSPLPLAMAGIDQRIAPLDLLASLAGDATALPHIRSRCAGVVALATCHRRELYLEGVAGSEVRSLFARWAGGGESVVVVREGAAAVEHLLRVAAGLESAVLGEDQILGQVRAAYRQACAGRLAGPLLHRAFHAAFRTGKRVRSETDLGGGGRSLAGSAVALLGRRLGGLEAATVLVLGAGEMASLAATRLRARGAGGIVVCSRTFSRAAALAAQVGGQALPWEWREQALSAADGVIAAVSAPAPVLSAAALRSAAQRGRLVAVDLGLPRNLEPPAETMPGLEVIDLDAMRTLLASHAAQRRGAVAQAEGIVAVELAAYTAWLASRRESDVHSPTCCRQPAVG